LRQEGPFQSPFPDELVDNIVLIRIPRLLWMVYALTN
jgi:hypothetical protein